eukprot:m.181807 g.181807  ORF g.181807 m.181807 type:complete len:202 (+) comp15519_c0_seq5:586-1191(+)
MSYWILLRGDCVFGGYTGRVGCWRCCKLPWCFKNCIKDCTFVVKNTRKYFLKSCSPLIFDLKRVCEIIAVGGSPPLDMYLKSIGIKRPEAVPSPKTVYTTNAPVLIENGCLDKLTSAEIKTNFYKEMGENNVDFIFTDYADADHGFALPPSLGPPGKLHEKADLRSTQRMLAMFREVWPDCAQRNVPSNAAGTTILSPASL